MLVAGGANGRFQRSRAQLLPPTMGVDGGALRPSGRTLHRGEWSPELGGLVIFGGETDEEMCDAQVYCLKKGIHGWKWEVVPTTGDDSMPVPGKPNAKNPMAPWANKGGEGDAGNRIGHCFTRTRNFMVLTGGIRDRGALQNEVYVLDINTGEWNKPVIRLTPPCPNALHASARTLIGTTPEGRPTARTGHSATGFAHGIVMFGGFDGSYLGDVQYLHFVSGVGLVLREKQQDPNSSVKRVNRYEVAEILPGSHAAENARIKVGDYVMKIGSTAIHEDMELSEVTEKMWGKIGSMVEIQLLRYVSRIQPPEDLGVQVMRRGMRLHHTDGAWAWTRPGVSIEELTDLNWYMQSGVSGVGCQPSPRFYHSAAAIDNDLLVFGGYDGTDYMNDLYLLETFADGDFDREWKWRTPTTAGPAPSKRAYTGMGVVGRKAIVTGGMEGRERLGDIYILDCDDWTWTNLELSTMIPIAQHCVATYDTYPTVAQYDMLSNAELQSMTMEQLYDVVRSKGDAAMREHKPTNKGEVINLIRCLMLRPGILLHSGHQTPQEEGEKKGRRNDTWILELPYSRIEEQKEETDAPSPNGRLSCGSGHENHVGEDRTRSRKKTDPHSLLWRERTETAHQDLGTDVLAVGRNVQGYLGLGLDSQPSHPHDSGLGPARGAHDTNPTICIRLGMLSSRCFDYHPSALEPTMGKGECVVRVACGAGHVFALCKNGQLFAWVCICCVQICFWIETLLKHRSDILSFFQGQNESGQLGLGDNRQRQSPKVVYTFPAGSHILKNVACGDAHSLAISTRDELFTWGKNGHGQLGLGHTNDRNSPQRVESLCFRALQHIAGGRHHSLAFVQSGGLHSFGCNDQGQLGTGSQIGFKVPTAVALLHEVSMVSIGAGATHCAAVSSAGACYTWGGGLRGQLGHGRFEDSWLATEVTMSGLEGKEASQTACGDSFTAILAKDPSTQVLEAWMFGSNKHGELGFGAGGQDCAMPVFVQHFINKELIDINLGSAHCLATCKDGMVYGWGRNRSGQLGLGHTRDMWAPQQIVLEEAGMTSADNYPWLAKLPQGEVIKGIRTGNLQVTTKAFAGHDASFFVCGQHVDSSRPENSSERESPQFLSPLSPVGHHKQVR